jgi:hypothetical protein
MSTTARYDRHQLSQHDRTRNMVAVAAAALTAAIGYAIGEGMARATEYAEQVEEDEYCHATDRSPAR